jgi:hypothetical protein
LSDCVLLVFSPLLALALGFAVSGTALTEREVVIVGHHGTVAGMCISTFIMAHLFAVVFRSHGNPAIFRLYPVRFVAVPPVLFAAMCLSRTLAASVSVLATWWDVYHSSMQTFGLGRMYDARRGSDPEVGRGLDAILNVLLYAGPILAGATLMDHVEDFGELADVGYPWFTVIPAYARSHCRSLTWMVLGLALPFFVYYVVSYWRLHRRGYRVAPLKVALLVSTGVCSIVTWGFNPFGQAFFIMNFFHSLQYFTLLWVVERRSMAALFRLRGARWQAPLTLAVFVAIAFGYGSWAEFFAQRTQVGFNATLVVAIMHFWYDGFIWSVRKRQVLA